MADMAEKAHENRVRRAAGRQGLTLRKTRRRDVLATDFGWYIMRGQRQLAHFHKLADVERWLLHPEKRAQMTRSRSRRTA